ASPPDKVKNIQALKNTVLKRMIIETLLLQEAEQKGITVTDEELNRYVNNIKKGYSKEEFDQLLLSQFKTYEDWVGEVRNSLLVEKALSRDTIEKITIQEKDISDYYNKNYAGKTSEPKIKLAQIFTRSKENAEKAVNEINNGLSFSEAAKNIQNHLRLKTAA
ncbi:MAG: SurA N-terminal domain-containing protein, partial [Pseudomonadota bacterium]